MNKPFKLRVTRGNPAVSRRMIVHVSGGIDAEMALDHVGAVVRMGRVSTGLHGPAFCHATTFRTGVEVFARRNKTSDTFWVSAVEGPVHRAGADPYAEAPA